MDPRQRRVVVAHDTDAAFQLVGQHGERAFKPVVDVYLLLGCLIHVGVALHHAHQVGDPVGAVLDRLDEPGYGQGCL